MAKAERAPILRVLEAARWRVAGPSGAAERLGLRPTTLEPRRKKLGIPRPGQHSLPVGSGIGTPDLVCGDAAGDLR
jgi:Bacterial regulatory protein, Fis family